MDDETKLTWIQSDTINPEHGKLMIGQVYLWFVTSDRMLAIVGKGEKWQFPGGKPDEGETVLETLARETYEEAGIRIEDYNEVPELFGYYLTENDPNPIWEGQTYLKLRFLLRVEKDSSQIILSNNERDEDLNTLEEAKFVHIDDLVSHIHWIEDREEYRDVLKQINGMAA